MNGISVPMAVVDFIPVIMFFIAAVILQRDLYSKMSKGAFALLAAGSIMVFLGGSFKALWKLLYALNICDFDALNKAFFPMQGCGFLLFFLGLLRVKNRRQDAAVLAVPAVYTSNLIFIVMQTVGLAGSQAVLAIKAAKMKKGNAVICFAVSFIFMLGMGYLGSRFDSSSKMNWIAQLTNIVSQGALLLGVIILHKAGLDK